MPRRTIDADGNLVVVGENGNTGVGSGDLAAADSQPPQQQSLMASLQSMQTINAFGFQLPARQFWIGLAVVALFVGVRGALGLLMALACYTMYMRSTANSSSSQGRASRSTWQSSGGGGGGGTGGSNVRGMSDLPCDPKVG